MTSRQFLGLVAAVQAALLLAVVLLIILNRWVRQRLRARVHPQRVAVDETFQRWALGQARPAEVLEGLGRLPVPLAIDALVTWSARVANEGWQELSRALEFEEVKADYELVEAVDGLCLITQHDLGLG